MSTSVNTQSSAPIPKLKESYSDYIFEWIPSLQRDAATNGYDEHLGLNPPIQPAAPVAGMTDTARLSRLKLIEMWRKPMNLFLNFIRTGAEGTAFADVIQPHILVRNPIAALAAIRGNLVRNSGLTSEKEILTRIFDTYSKSGNFRNYGSLELDLVHATTLITTAANSLTVGVPVPPGHPAGAPHPNDLTDNERMLILRKLLIPLQRFEPVFVANQVPMINFDGMVNGIRTAIASINAYKAYSNNDDSAANMKAIHQDNEVDVAAPAQDHSKRGKRGRSPRSNSPNNQRSRSADSNVSAGSVNSNNSHNSNQYRNQKRDNYANGRLNERSNNYQRNAPNSRNYQKYGRNSNPNNYNSRSQNYYRPNNNDRSQRQPSYSYCDRNNYNSFPRNNSHYNGNRNFNPHYAHVAPNNIQYIPYYISSEGNSLQPIFPMSMPMQMTAHHPQAQSSQSSIPSTNLANPTPVAFSAYTNLNSPFQQK